MFNILVDIVATPPASGRSWGKSEDYTMHIRTMPSAVSLFAMLESSWGWVQRGTSAWSSRDQVLVLHPEKHSRMWQAARSKAWVLLKWKFTLKRKVLGKVRERALPLSSPNYEPLFSWGRGWRYGTRNAGDVVMIFCLAIAEQRTRERCQSLILGEGVAQGHSILSPGLGLFLTQDSLRERAK